MGQLKYYKEPYPPDKKRSESVFLSLKKNEKKKLREMAAESKKTMGTYLYHWIIDHGFFVEKK